MAAEALAIATPGSIVIADDFGDQLDAATAEHFAAALRQRAPPQPLINLRRCLAPKIAWSSASVPAIIARSLARVIAV